jgi:enediyne biosynthesis protein E4
MNKSRRRLRQALIVVVIGCLIWVAPAWWNGRRNRLALLEVKSEMASSRFGIASRRLIELLARNPGSNEAAYLLGKCELQRGHEKAASEAWARVAPGCEFSSEAIRARMRIAENQGRFADAERLIYQAAEDPRNDRSELRSMLVPLYSQLGRIDECERLVEARWEHLNAIGEGASERAIFQLRLHIVLSLKPNSVENIRAYLDRFARLAPDDDRIWLGRANLAIRTGDLDQAKRWLDACLERRPDDDPVWRARLNWALAANQIEGVRQALKHVPAAESTAAQLHRLNAWLFAHRADRGLERRELEKLVAVAPADLAALDRLIRRAGTPEEAAGLSRKKDEIERLRARYEKLYGRKQPTRDALEMARIAEQLGRRFEARAFLALAIAEEPERDQARSDLARLAADAPPKAAISRTLADALAPELHL